VTPLYPQKLALTSPTGGGRSVGMVRSRTKSHGVFSYDNDALSNKHQNVRLFIHALCKAEDV